MVAGRRHDDPVQERRGGACVLTGVLNGHKIVVMSRKPPFVLRERSAVAETVGAAAFKAQCLDLMDRVHQTGVEYVVTKHGRPVAKLVPYTGTARAALFGALEGSVLAYDRPLDPLDDDYDVNRD